MDSNELSVTLVRFTPAGSLQQVATIFLIQMSSSIHEFDEEIIFSSNQKKLEWRIFEGGVRSF